MRVWYIPSWNGDYRLEATEDGKCQLAVVDPTPAEKAVLKTFLKVARENGWTRSKRLPGKKPLALDVTVSVAGLVLVAAALPEASTLTAVKFASGKLEVATGAKSEEVAALAKKAEGEKAEAAASVKRPTCCCPSCVPGAIGPASEVLLTFLDADQHEDWARERWIEVTGGVTGHRYVIAHRHSEPALEWKKITFDRDDEIVIHFHDVSVPPEEEVLSAKLILESEHEGWLRNEATTFGGTDVLKNPFGGIQDGVADAAFMSSLGMLTTALAGGPPGAVVGSSGFIVG